MRSLGGCFRDEVARLVPFSDRTARREPGSARGLFTMKRNFDAPLPAKLRRFFGS
jgi:antitoxin (DNA-binding transcriptional repressor) of toxin-antitoxin stability system